MTHLRNLDNKAGEIDEAYKKLRKEFQRIATDVSANEKAETGDNQGIRAESAGPTDQPCE